MTGGYVGIAIALAGGLTGSTAWMYVGMTIQIGFTLVKFWLVWPRRAPGSPSDAAGLAAHVAARVAGRRRASDAESWLADLGSLAARRDQRRYAAGLLVAAVRMRAVDVLEAWLRSSGTVGATCFAVGAAVTVRLWTDGGFLEVAQNGEGLVLLTAAPWAAAAALRRVRGVEPGRDRASVR